MLGLPRTVRTKWLVRLRALVAGEPTPQSGAVEPPDPHIVEATLALQRADAARDGGKPALAAELYLTAASFQPSRADIQVQLGNMLKDSRQYDPAEAAYRTALTLHETADTHLQLGHVLKVTGKRDAAIEAYRRALILDPGHSGASRELSDLGDPAEQARRILDGTAGSSAADLLALRLAVDGVRAQLERISQALPDVLGNAAVPVELYDLFRSRYPLPSPAPTSSPSFHVLILADREAPATLFEQIERIRTQTFANWTLSVIGRGGDQRRVVELAAAAEPRVRWFEIPAGTVPARAEMEAGQASQADWLLLLAGGAILHPHALAWFARASDLTRAEAFFCDEDGGAIRTQNGDARGPVLRQVADFDSLLDRNVLGETLAVRTEAFSVHVPWLEGRSTPADRATLLLALVAGDSIGHVPFPLVRREETGQPHGPDHQAGVARFIERSGLAGQIALHPGARAFWVPRQDDARIAVIIPTRDNATDLEAMIESLYATAQSRDGVEILVIDNGTSRSDDLDILSKIARQDSVRVLRRDEPFNWSHLNNEAVSQTDAQLVIFANDDMVMRSAGWDVRVRGLLQRRDVGAVGSRLLYEDGTIQHAGVLFGWKGSDIHDGLHASGSAEGPTHRWQVTRSVSAVTGAFLATRRSDFLDLGGFDAAAMPVSYSDIDYGLKLRGRGLRILWTPDITLTHRESKSRGLDHLDDWRAARGAHERRVIAERWGDVFSTDPGVHPWWYPAALPFRLLAPVPVARSEEHILQTSRRNPWKVSPVTEADPLG